MNRPTFDTVEFCNICRERHARRIRAIYCRIKAWDRERRGGR